MSLILDALRKMEQERRSRRGAAQDIRPEVLRYRQAAQPKERARFPLAVVAGAVLLCAGLAAGFLLKGHGPVAVADTAPAAAPAAQPPAAALPPAAPVQAPVPAAPAAPVAVAAARTPAAETRAPVIPAEQPPRASRAALPAQAQVPPDAVPQRVSHQEAVAASAGGQDFTISGIAYQDERRLRRAVVNGALVGEGAEVAGARVVEIKETKVRLSRGGQLFEVPFSSGLQSR